VNHKKTRIKQGMSLIIIWILLLLVVVVWAKFIILVADLSSKKSY
jgi:hypothetical protein